MMRTEMQSADGLPEVGGLILAALLLEWVHDDDRVHESDQRLPGTRWQAVELLKRRAV